MKLLIRKVFIVSLIILLGNMQVNQKGIDLIKEAEGFHSEPYYCPAGKLTVGYGNTFNVKGPVTKEQAEKDLKAEVDKLSQALKPRLKVELNENQFSALISFIYNLGMGTFDKSTLKRHINSGNLELAASEFTKWVYAKDKKGNMTKLPGLVTRRQKEKDLWLLPS